MCNANQIAETSTYAWYLGGILHHSCLPRAHFETYLRRTAFMAFDQWNVGMTLRQGMHRLDSDWHHIAVSWEKSSGATVLWFDGNQHSPFRVCRAGRVSLTGSNKSRKLNLAAGTVRGPEGGSIVVSSGSTCITWLPPGIRMSWKPN